MEQNQDKLKEIISHSKEYGFVFPSSEIYDGLAATYDYGQLGVELKNNIKAYWWKSMVQMHSNIVGLDTSIFMHPTIWEASGHVDAFNDPLIDNKDSKKRYRADVLIEEHLEKIKQKIDKEVTKAKERFGAAFDEDQFRATNPNVLRNAEKILTIENRMRTTLGANDLEGVRQLIIDLEIYLNDYESFSIKAPTSFLSYTHTSNNITDIILKVTIPANATGLDRSDVIILEYKLNGATTKTEYIMVTQTAI